MVGNERFRKKFGVSPKGKEIYIVNVPNTNLFRAEFYPGGEIPKILGGNWTDVPALERKIQTYLNNCYAKAERFNQKAHLNKYRRTQKVQKDAAKTLTAEVELKEECQE